MRDRQDTQSPTLRREDVLRILESHRGELADRYGVTDWGFSDPWLVTRPDMYERKYSEIRRLPW